MPTVSLCIIMKNEERNIRRCLESARPFVNEIIAVDTGSNDHTREICKEYGAIVFDLPWPDDFSKVRNYALEQVSCDWILCLDADEELACMNFEKAGKVLQETPGTCLRIRMVNFYGPEPAVDKRANIYYAHRMFRNKSGIKYKGAIHETLELPSGEAFDDDDINPSIQILHYGYMDRSSNEKSNRNISMLLKEKSVHPDNAWLDYNAAAEYYRSGELTKSFRLVNSSILQFVKGGHVPPALVYKLKYDILITSESFQEALKGIDKAITLYPDYVDLHFYKGIAELFCRTYESAARTFCHCLVIGESNPNYLILAGTGSFLALYYLGLCYEEMQKSDEALECYQQSVSLFPEFSAAEQRLRALKKEAAVEQSQPNQ